MQCVLAGIPISNASQEFVFTLSGDDASPPYKFYNTDNIEHVFLNVNSPMLSDNSVGTHIYLRDLGSGRLKLKQPLIVTLAQAADDEYIASFPEAELSRSGETAIEAINLLKSSIVELYKLFKGEVRLGPLPRRQLWTLEKYIGPGVRLRKARRKTK